MKFLVIAIFIACFALTINADSEGCQNAKEELNLKFEIQNDQQHDSDERFVAVHVNKMGIEHINPNLPSIAVIVEPFLPKNYQFLYAINVTREIVNGFKYEVVFVTKAEEDDEEIFCLIEILEKPWLVKDSRKFRKMVFNNCSFENPVDDQSTFQYEVNPTFVNQKTDLSEEELKRMEDQIISLKDSDEETETTTVTFEDITLGQQSKNILDELFKMQDFMPQPEQTTPSYSSTPLTLSNFNIANLDEMISEAVTKKTFDNAASPTKSDNETLSHLETNIKRAFSELFQSDPEFQSNIIALVNRRDDLDAQKNYNRIIEILGRKLKDKIESFQQNNYDASDNEQQQNEPIVNREKRSNNNFEFNVKNLNCNNELTCADCFLEVNSVGGATNARCQNRVSQTYPTSGLPGGINPLEETDPVLKIFLNDALTEINAKVEPDYESGPISDSSIQIVAGTLHRFKAALKRNGRPVNCHFEVWERVWIKDGRKVDVKCDDAEPYKLTQAPRTSRRKRSPQGLGSKKQKNVEVNDPEANELLKAHIGRVQVHGGRISVVSIDKITKKIVSGVKYKYKGTFRVGQATKACNLEIWHRAWVEGDKGTQVDAECDDGAEYKSPRRRRRSPQEFEGVGKKKEVETDNEDVTKILKEHINRLETGSDKKLELVSIEKVTKQVVAGIKYIVTGNFKFGDENKKCVVEIWQRQWIEGDEGTQLKANCDEDLEFKTPVKPKEESEASTEAPKIEIKEAPKEEVKEIVTEAQKVEVKEVPTEAPNAELKELPTEEIKEEPKEESKPPKKAVGGADKLDPNDETVNNLLKDHLTRLDTGSDKKLVLVSVEKITKKIVRGILYKVTGNFKFGEDTKNCVVEIWQQDWKEGDEKTQLTANCDENLEFKTPVAKETPEEELTTDAPKEEIKETTVEEVSTEAPKTEVKEAPKEEVVESPKQEVQSRKKRSPQNVPGGKNGIPTDDEDANQLLKDHISRLETGDNKLELVSIEKITKQVVAGLKYVFTGNYKLGDETKHCEVEIWHRAWVQGDEGTQLKATCDNDEAVYKSSSRSKRSIHSHHHRPRPDHYEDHYQRSRERHHSAVKQMEELKAEVIFENYIQKYDRKYANDAERHQRLRIFKKNLHKIDMLNKHEQGTAKYGITEFADLTEKEYLRKTGLLVPERHENSLGNLIADIPDVPIPEEFDWRDKHVITDVKNQGNCGSCWSFSVTGNIEGLHAIKTGKLEAYSEQELLDCDTTDNACNGGYMDDAFKAIEKIGGLELEEEYPYMAKKQKKCMFNQTLSHVKVKGVVDLPKGDEIAMQKFLISTGPISIGINANAMQFYRGGVSHPWKLLCRKSNLDHGVLIVGFGKKEYPMFNKTLPYWTIKNSWGPKWGEQGYYRVYRGDNTCGVAEMASSAVLE